MPDLAQDASGFRALRPLTRALLVLLAADIVLAWVALQAAQVFLGLVLARSGGGVPSRDQPGGSRHPVPGPPGSPGSGVAPDGAPLPHLAPPRPPEPASPPGGGSRVLAGPRGGRLLRPAGEPRPAAGRRAGDLDRERPGGRPAGRAERRGHPGLGGVVVGSPPGGPHRPCRRPGARGQGCRPARSRGSDAGADRGRVSGDRAAVLAMVVVARITRRQEERWAELLGAAPSGLA
jgi:hypothetical protein